MYKMGGTGADYTNGNGKLGFSLCLLASIRPPLLLLLRDSNQWLKRPRRYTLLLFTYLPLESCSRERLCLQNEFSDYVLKRERYQEELK